MNSITAWLALGTLCALLGVGVWGARRIAASNRLAGRNEVTAERDAKEREQRQLARENMAAAKDEIAAIEDANRKADDEALMEKARKWTTK